MDPSRQDDLIKKDQEESLSEIRESIFDSLYISDEEKQKRETVQKNESLKFKLVINHDYENVQPPQLEFRDSSKEGVNQMMDYSSNMTLGEKWDYREKLRMAKFIRKTFPYEEHYIIIQNISEGEYATILDLEISAKNEKIATMQDLFNVSKKLLREDEAQKVCFSFDAKKLYSINEEKLADTLIFEYIEYQKLRKISLHLSQKNDEQLCPVIECEVVDQIEIPVGELDFQIIQDIQDDQEYQQIDSSSLVTNLSNAMNKKLQVERPPQDRQSIVDDSPGLRQRNFTFNELNMQKLQKGESIEFLCYTPQSGMLYGERKLQKKLCINIDGNLKILDMEPNKNSVYECTIHYNIQDLIRVIYGRESLKDDQKVTLVIDPFFKARIKNRQEIYHEFYFESTIFAQNLVEIIRKVSDQQTDALIEYTRRGTLFILEQCQSQKLFGRQVRNLRQNFHLIGISPKNMMSRDEYNKFLSDQSEKFKLLANPNYQADPEEDQQIFQLSLAQKIDRTYEDILDHFSSRKIETQSYNQPATKYANIEAAKILEENLVLSNDGSEAIFKVAEELQQSLYMRHISLDLKNKQLKIWSRNFEDNILTRFNPYNNALATKEDIIQLHPYMEDFQKKHSMLFTQQDSITAHSIDPTWILKRSLIDNRQLIIKIVQLNPNGESVQYTYNYIFSSVFRLMQFQELFDKIKFDQITVLLFQRFLRRHPYIDELCRQNQMPDREDENEDSDEEKESRRGTYGSLKEIQGDVGGSHRGSNNNFNEPQNQNTSQRTILLNQLIDHQNQNILKGLTLSQPSDDVKIMTLTWNMARKLQSPDFNKMLPNLKSHDLVVMTFQETKKRDQFLALLTKYMEQNGFILLKSIYMWEMVLIGFAQSTNGKMSPFNGKITAAQRACGVGKVVGNKGGLQMYFRYNDKYYNFIGCHLLHGQDNRIKRDEMIEELIKVFRIDRTELDPDMIADYNFIMGDLNYRFESTFEEMVTTEKLKMAPQLIDQLDQLTISRRGGQVGIQQPNGQILYKNITQKYPSYYEHKIKFAPTYKRNMDDNGFKNKKSQAPSYCDRILFKKNTMCDFSVNFYECIDDIFGSDHRPVVLSLSLKQTPLSVASGHASINTDPIHFQQNLIDIQQEKDGDLQILKKISNILSFQNGRFMNLDLSLIKQRYGVIRTKWLHISDLKLPQNLQRNVVLALSKQKPMITGISQHFQVSFYSDWVNDLPHSQEWSFLQKQEDSNQPDLTWEEMLIPPIYTPVNCLELLQGQRLIMVLWYIDETMKEQQVIGQVSIPMALFQKQQGDPQLIMLDQNVINANSVVAKIGIKMIYSVIN